MRWTSFILLALSAAFEPLFASDAKRATVPATAGVAKADQRKIDQLFADYNKPNSPGCALGVIRNGNFIYRKAYGMASLELGVPLSTESVFYMGSITKQFTAASILLAAEQGALSLDDNIRKYIPQLPDYGHTITLRHMLHHVSGIRDFYTLLSLAGRSRYDHQTTEEIIDLLASQKNLNFEPGSQYSYSNSNYLLLAEVIKRTTHKPLSAFAEENIFRPLGMTHTRIYDDNSVVLPGRVAGYSASMDGGFTVNWSTNFDLVGAGGLMSTVEDMLLWDRNFYGPHIGGSTFLKEMQTKGVLNDGSEIPYALALLRYSYRGLPVVEHSGTNFGYAADVLRFPEQRLSVITLCNLGNANAIGLSFQVADLFLEKDLQPLPAPSAKSVAVAPPMIAEAKNEESPRPDPATLASYIGEYASGELQTTYRLALEDGRLLLRIRWNPSLELKPLAKDEFSIGDGRYKAKFLRDPDRELTGLTISGNGIHDITFRKTHSESK